MTLEVQKSIDELKKHFKAHDVQVFPDEQGGAQVFVEDLATGSAYNASSCWMGFYIPPLYPRADIYPHFIPATLALADGRTLQSLGQGFSGPVEWQGRQAIQISRKSKGWDPEIDTAVTKLAQVHEWLKSRT